MIKKSTIAVTDGELGSRFHGMGTHISLLPFIREDIAIPAESWRL